MLKKINGPCFIDLINSGIKNLDKHRTVLNDLNVFPVPDGDTGTNMVMTLRYGFDAVKSKNRELCEIAREFSSAAVFGARGNSGVIISQFFKGLSNALDTLEEIDPAVFANALQNGCKYAYASVANPVEGTMLTVVKDASVAVTNALPLDSINEAVDIFLSEAKKSLQNTPELLPILKKASVVDSGGSGIVYFFEGVKKFLDGDSIDAPEKETTDKKEYIDLTRFNKNTSFEYGYCFEGLLQLRIDPEKFNHAAFKHELSGFADSIVSSQESDKLKLHAHTKTPENIFALCRKFGEFLTVKIENMTVQNIMKEQNEKKPPKFLYDPDRQPSGFAVVAVATNPYIQKKFFDMGADIVILSEIAPSSQDFMDAFKLTSSKRILVFPNSSNSILSSGHRHVQTSLPSSLPVSAGDRTGPRLSATGSQSGSVQATRSTMTRSSPVWIHFRIFQTASSQVRALMDTIRRPVSLHMKATLTG